MGKNFNKTIKHFLSGGIMGIDKDVVDLMSIALEVIGKKTFKGVLICELGNQKMRFGKYKTGKKYFKAFGAKHISIDWNGKSGAKKLNLAEPINRWKNTFDIVSNYGTSEHVEGQADCFRNIHNFCNMGGVMVHAVPLKGTYKGHSPYHYDQEFFDMLAAANNYIMVKNEVRHRSNIAANVCVVMIKGMDNEFNDKTIH